MWKLIHQGSVRKTCQAKHGNCMKQATHVNTAAGMYYICEDCHKTLILRNSKEKKVTQ
jgi:hypothetical protein